MLPTLAWAQEGSIAAPPHFVPGTGIYSTKPDEAYEPQGVYSTKQPQAKPAPQPWQQPLTRPAAQQDAQVPFGRVEPVYEAPAAVPRQPTYNEPRQVPSGNVPFGRASQEVYAPVPTGPRDVTAAPVEEVGVSNEELEPARAPDPVALAPKDPTEPTPQTTPIFEAENEHSVPLRYVVLRALNKVTGRTTEVKGLTGSVMRFGNLEIIAKSCRKSAASSQLDYASLLDIRELKPDEESKELFSGWMYASSPSLMALEHPVYDVGVVECRVSAAKPSDEPKPAEKNTKKTRP